MLESKNIFVPRNSDRHQELKNFYVNRGYKESEIFVGNIVNEVQLKGIKIVIGNINIDNVKWIDNIHEVTGTVNGYSLDFIVRLNKLLWLKFP